MRAVVQRVSRAAVRVDRETVGSIGPGLCVLLSVAPDDDDSVAARFAARILGLRIFADPQGKMNLDCATAGGEVLLVSQFTLHADASRGHRPSFIRAASPDQAERLYQAFGRAVESAGVRLATGRFGAHMELDLCNDGPVTLVVSAAEAPWNADSG